MGRVKLIESNGTTSAMICDISSRESRRKTRVIEMFLKEGYVLKDTIQEPEFTLIFEKL